MPYRFATEDQDYSDYASGRVLYNLPGAPAFPVRLVSEIFQRAVARLQPSRPVHIYDPVCGSAYHLTVLGFLHGRQIGSILASDINDNVVSVADRNLGLLSAPGMSRREAELRRMLDEFHKESHAGALASLAALRTKLAAAGHTIQTSVFQANALEPIAHPQLENTTIDLIISDVPYGNLSGWQGMRVGTKPPLRQMLDILLSVLAPGGLVVIAADKAQKISHPGYRRVEHFQIGHRQVSFFQPVPPTAQ